ncbi:hypothetical protein GCM10023093_07460 [Nemorincola caseinilytica]|uniref:Uncharacterized protein n=1 Tax=Nemorincola caseinilytica TaxID=2054315 RepID=A0ABP8N9H3_9BACT
MIVVPAEIPVTSPSALIVPTLGVLLTHVPPLVLSVSHVEFPSQTSKAPPIEAGVSLMVTLIVVVHPLSVT